MGSAFHSCAGLQAHLRATRSCSDTSLLFFSGNLLSQTCIVNSSFCLSFFVLILSLDCEGFCQREVLQSRWYSIQKLLMASWNHVKNVQKFEWGPINIRFSYTKVPPGTGCKSFVLPQSWPKILNVFIFNRCEKRQNLTLFIDCEQFVIGSFHFWTQGVSRGLGDYTVILEGKLPPWGMIWFLPLNMWRECQSHSIAVGI